MCKWLSLGQLNSIINDYVVNKWLNLPPHKKQYQPKKVNPLYLLLRMPMYIHAHIHVCASSYIHSHTIYLHIHIYTHSLICIHIYIYIYCLKVMSRKCVLLHVYASLCHEGAIIHCCWMRASMIVTLWKTLALSL